jgi:hypothetical protein
VQGKPLAAALLVSLCLLVGCGAGGGEEDSTAPQGSRGSPAQATGPQGVEEAAAQLHESTARVKHERQSQERQGASSGAPQSKSPDPRGANLPPAQPTDTHHDSGGGTAQFAPKRGDNSIQESGREGSAAETQAAAAVLHAYLDARVAHRWADACFYMSAGYAATVEAFAQRFAKGKALKSCAEVLAALATGSSQQALEATARADVGALRTEGDHGFVLYRGAGGAPYAMPMVLEGGAWKVGSLEGAALG